MQKCKYVKKIKNKDQMNKKVETKCINIIRSYNKN